ncbi:putative heme/steroid binding protein [Sugiyamaella lignohabitans]|uniref:Putative heme/steroid binding protein n=1 Tax=Sugiyamaella lignohabitans TaxID=796027 RepID=A0A167EYN2_9ASCO|nr:putative heme/steroid binding protein [Sugiyamaella lignohabitans]ANB14614.1 putative heme/steroid binding protein [Sugiyamaella lignohabitans]
MSEQPQLGPPPDRKKMLAPPPGNAQSTLFPSINSAQRASGSRAISGPQPAAAARRKKVALQPGHSALDWANLRNSGANLRVGTCSPPAAGAAPQTPLLLSLRSSRVSGVPFKGSRGLSDASGDDSSGARGATGSGAEPQPTEAHSPVPYSDTNRFSGS